MENIVDGFVGDGEKMDFGAIVKKWKPILIVVVGLFIVGVLAYAALGVVQSPPISMSFEKGEISPGERTILKVAVVNTGEVDAKNVTISIMPESDVLSIANPVRIEPVIGSKSKRVFEFDVGSSAGATPGTYKVTAKVSRLLEEEQFATGYLEIK